MSELAAHLPGIVVAWTGVGLGLISPGPNQLAVMGTAMARGRGPGLALALGIAMGTATWSLLCTTGFARLFSESGPAMNTLRFGAAVYLAFLAVRSWRSARSAEPPRLRTLSGGRPIAFVIGGLGVQATNLKAAFYWALMAALGIGAGMPLSGVVALVTGCALISGAGHAVYALVFSHPPTARAYEVARPIIQGLLCAFFCIASVTILTAPRL